jgi:Tfp pilus assembly protein PilF
MSTAAPVPSSPRRRTPLIVGGVLVLLVAAGIVGYVVWKGPQLPQPGEPKYEEYVEAFEIGTAALDVGLNQEAESNLSKAVELVPREPAGWANRGLFYLRTNQLPKADQDLKRAEKLAPENADIQKLLGLLERRQGKYSEAAARFRKAAEKDPQDVELLYALATSIDKEQKPGVDTEYQKLMEQILAVRPNNVFALYERLRVAARRKDDAATQETLARFRAMSPGWTGIAHDPEQTRRVFAELEQSLKQQDNVQDHILRFRNVLTGEAEFAHDATELAPQDSQMGSPLRQVVVLAPIRTASAPPDAAITFIAEPLADAPAGKWDVAVPVWTTADGPPTVYLANAKEVRRTGGDTVQSAIPLAADGLLPMDWNNDFRTEFLLVGPGGLRLFKQQPDGKFMDVTNQTKLPPEIVKGDYAAALVADYDMDGDLDILLAKRTGAPVVLRNNLDGSFTPVAPFTDVENVRAFAWADFDHDGVADAAMIDAKGVIHVFANERSGRFAKWPAKLPDGRYLALAVADIDEDGVLDLVAARGDGVVVRIAGRDHRGAWNRAEIGKWAVPEGTEPGGIRLFSADLDNNGVPDVIASGPAGSAIWLGSGNGVFSHIGATLPARIVAIADLAARGRLDLLSLDADGKPILHRNAGTKDYKWQSLRFRAQPQENTSGDNRINSFGIGGEVETRTGSFVVKQPLSSQVVHIGLGEKPRADLIRIQWPNGQFQIEFRPDVNQVFSPQQRLKGSCPFLFTWNGERFVFVTDFMWSTPLGLYINAQNRGGFLQSREWVRVRGDQLVPRDGCYETRAQANLWETHFFDHLALHVIDHPANTELYVDERFALGPAEPTFRITAPARPVAQAWDHHGVDVTSIVNAVDGNYLDHCGRGLYQGITNDHWVEVDLGENRPTIGPVWLIAAGWIHPTDSSINFALEQGTNTRPKPLALEVPDGKGGWTVANDRIGFPAGKNKTVLIRLDGVGGPGVPRRVRLRTNMEIFWDALTVARGIESPEIRKTELRPASAELRYRGILEMTQANASSPELPDYDRIASRTQVWRDLIGFHTRHGDVKELLDEVDDRYAIVNAGDEIALKFAAPAAPPSGWTRDFIWVSDGWEKDGDFNTRWGKTVLPLPYHGMTSYDSPPGRLEDDPVFKKHRKDWDVFHTRYVTPTTFERGLRPRK